MSKYRIIYDSYSTDKDGRATRISAHHQCGDCDCACASILVQHEPWETRLTDMKYLSNQSVQLHSLDERHWITFGKGIHPAVLNDAALELLNGYKAPQYPWRVPLNENDATQVALTQLVTCGLLIPEKYTPVLPTESNTILAAWLHTTDRCNLRCDYCYLPHARADMSSATGHAVIDATFRSALAHGYRAVKLKYAGGEPLLRFPLVLELHRYAQSQAQQQGLELDSVVLSNGTLLTEDMVETLRAAGMRLMISLDGLGTYHDIQRHFPDGRGSFNFVARAIDLALAGGLVPDISITISGRNVADLPDVVAWVLERDLPFSLNFYRENERSASQRNLGLEEDQIIEGMLAAYKVIETNMPRRSLLASLVDRANLAVSHLRTCSAGRDYLVFDTQGHVAKCQMALAQPVTDCSSPDPLDAIRSSPIGLQNLKVDDKTECQNCEWRYWCGGGCPLETYRATGRYDVKSPKCNIYKTLYPEVVRLEGLRLLKYAEEG